MKIIPNRKISGYSAVLLPFTSEGTVDWKGFCEHISRTSSAGLIPAVNMDTGYGNKIDEKTRVEVLRCVRDIIPPGEFVVGAFVPSKAGDVYKPEAYYQQIEQIQSFGGIPVIIQSFGLNNLPSDQLIKAYTDFGSHAPQFIAFELGPVFAPFGKIFDLSVYEGLLSIKECIGAKHSSLNRIQEWDRINLRNRVRPGFKVLTGNDLAIDMVMYGSDYLLGISTFAPDYFSLRDRFWLEGNPKFFQLNDVLQYLGFFTFRHPIQAYKHSAAQFLKLRGWITSDRPFPKSLERPKTDIPILKNILDQLENAA